MRGELMCRLCGAIFALIFSSLSATTSANILVTNTAGGIAERIGLTVLVVPIPTSYPIPVTSLQSQPAPFSFAAAFVPAVAVLASIGTYSATACVDTSEMHRLLQRVDMFGNAIFVNDVAIDVAWGHVGRGRDSCGSAKKNGEGDDELHNGDPSSDDVSKIAHL
jgi:hypothetical protein